MFSELMLIHIFHVFLELPLEFMDVLFVDTVALEQASPPPLCRVESPSWQEQNQLLPVESYFFYVTNHDTVLI